MTKEEESQLILFCPVSCTVLYKATTIPLRLCFVVECESNAEENIGYSVCAHGHVSSHNKSQI